MLDRKNGLKMIEFSSSLNLNEIHVVYSSFNEDPKIFQEGPYFREGRPENLGKMGNNWDIYCYANWEIVNFKMEY